MSQQDVETVRSFAEPFRGVDFAALDFDAPEIRAAIEAAHTPDVEVRTLETGIGMGIDPLYHGPDGFAEYMRAWLEPFREYYMDFLDFIDDGDRVLVPIRARGIGVASGAEAELELTLAYEVRDGRIARLIQYETVEEARRAAAG
jgi:ketosteroid isomerase-like protein